jgi:glycosyltransferase involved in cell wall biosynthesis
MRVAFVTHQFFPAFYTGVERLTLNLASQLSRMGHECTVVTVASASSGSLEPYDVDGVRVRPVEGSVSFDLRGDAESAQAVGRVLDEERIELVHVMQPLGLPGAFTQAAIRDLPLVAHLPDFSYACPRITLLRVDGSDCPTSQEGVLCGRTCRITRAEQRHAHARRLLDQAAAVISPCRATIATHAAHGFDTGGWCWIPWGVDYALHPGRLPAPTEPELRIGFLGTLVPHKGAHVLVEALRLAPDAPVALELYGDSFHARDYERELRSRAGDDARIRFQGTYNHGEFLQVLAALDLVAIPSLWHENLPTSGLNAIASGVPLAVSDMPGLRELVDDYACGWTFPAGDPAALAELLTGLAGDRERLAERRRELVSPPSLEEEAFAVERVHAAVLAGAPPPEELVPPSDADDRAAAETSA